MTPKYIHEHCIAQPRYVVAIFDDLSLTPGFSPVPAACITASRF
jgi:hypothetical protein